MRLTRSFREVLHEALQDPVEAEAYLELAVELYEEDGNTEAFLASLRSVAEAQGGLVRLAARTRGNFDQILPLLNHPQSHTHIIH